MDISEKNLEDTIEGVLLAPVTEAPKDRRGKAREADAGYSNGEFKSGGYRKRTSADYDKKLCLIPGDVLDFVYATQPKEWKMFRNQFGSEDEAKEKFFQRLSQELRNANRGTLDVLRNGIKANGAHFRLAYFRPSSGLNPDIQRLYEANLFSVVRQLHYSEKNQNSLDIAIFLNGLPIFTAELKNDLTGQTAQKDAIRQYRDDRDPKEPLFAFGRCLAHFAVDPERVYVTTHLQGPQTTFLPFNQGRNGGAGNPISYRSFATAYLWEQIWARDSVLNLVQHFIQVVDEEDDKGRKTNKRSLIFPRYHQLDCVRRLIADARKRETGQRYLIQHSAGSGKSNTLAWLAHQLSILHNDADKRVFDSIIVITDRRILDKQLQRTVRQFEQTQGVVENIDTTSKQLKQALEEGKTIIVTTLQKFPVIAREIESLPGKRFAVAIDEAHSSQSGSSTDSLRKILAVATLEAAEREESDELEDNEDLIAKEVKKRGLLPNVSYFAFTATPKQKTLELFGTRMPEGHYEAFSLYTMRQAIEEGFILDVLQNYTTYHAYWNLLKKIEEDPRYDRTKATYLLRYFVDLHSHTINKKVAIMVEHFVGQVAHRIDGKAKAMIVTRSRLHAVRYKQELDRYLKGHGYPYKALVAFSGTVKDDDFDYTEAHMNGFPESQTAETFKRDEYRFLVVANKFQTGFDQPLLHTMYVDKKLGGVNAVQTLSRLNRTHPGKEETMVLDFANEAEDIQKAFAPYYEKTFLTEGTDPNLLYDLQTRLAAFQLYTETEVSAIAEFTVDPKATQDKVHAALTPIVDRYKELPAEEQADFRGQLTDYIRLYGFLSQIITFVDLDLERLYLFSRLLLRKLPILDGRLPVEILRHIDIESYLLQQTSSGSITLPRSSGDIKPMRSKRTYIPIPEERELLSQIIQSLNEYFGTTFTEEDAVCITELEQRIAANAAIEASVRVNSVENARLTFDQVVNELLQSMMEGNIKFYRHVNDDEEFAKFFLNVLFERYMKRVKQPSS
jgi:type I restriction enzyme R subunit